jgi:hypothetical protein
MTLVGVRPVGNLQWSVTLEATLPNWQRVERSSSGDCSQDRQTGSHGCLARVSYSSKPKTSSISYQLHLYADNNTENLRYPKSSRSMRFPLSRGKCLCHGGVCSNMP